MLDMDILNDACETVRAMLPDAKPYCALVLGSGWSSVVEGVQECAALDYDDMPCMGGGTVKGHAGRMSILEWEGVEVLAFQGRRHWYEGEGWAPVILPVILSLRLGAQLVVLTNAAGSIRETLSPGNLMIIDDHINTMASNPLFGQHHPELGPRFPDQSQVYSRQLRELLDKAGRSAGINMAHGIYLATPGPMYETPAEVSAFGAMGADAVGMSTVPEAIVASAAGLQVAGLSCITNMAAGMSDTAIDHKGALETTRNAREDMHAVLSGFFRFLKDAGDQ